MDLNELIRDGGVSLDAFLDAAEREAPIVVEQTEEQLAARGISVLDDLARAVPQTAEEASELLAGVLTTHLVELGFAYRRQPAAVDAAVFRIRGTLPRGGKGMAAELHRAVRREAQRQREQIRVRAPVTSNQGVDPGVWDALLKTDTGAAASSWHNACLVLERDPRWKGRLARCLFRNRVVLDGGSLEREQILQARRWLEAVYGLRCSTDWTREAMVVVAAASGVHPVRRYLDGLVWDGIERLDTMLEDWFQVAPSALTRRYGPCWLIGAVARVFEPGCKLDTMLVLVGEQGTLKSTAIRAIAGEWFRDTPLELGSKEAYQQIRGSWLHELAELKSFKGVDAETIRAFLSSPVDSYRPTWGEDQVDVPRQCVFVGTVNPVGGQARFLRDPAGSRRFWVVEVTDRIDTDQIRTVRDQLWAEAVARYRAGEAWHLEDDEEQIRRQLNAAYQEIDHWAESLHTVIDELEAETPPGEELRISARRLVSSALGIPPERADGRPTRRAVEILSARGYQRAYRKRPGERDGAWWWVRSASPTA